jgi:hypothetical protein
MKSEQRIKDEIEILKSQIRKLPNDSTINRLCQNRIDELEWVLIDD